ncbi:MAG: KH domain-containing protein [Clostridia bacterium]|nr:KH domain-containing protein [Clostridia bacterium]
MEEIVKFLVSKLIDEDKFEIITEEESNNVDIRVMVDDSVIQRVIGKGGKTAKAIRSIVKNFSAGNEVKYNIFIENKVND